MLFSLQNIIKHPSYKTDQKYHDIAIIELKWEVEFAPNIFPACLNINESDEKKELTVIGFGRTNRDDCKFVVVPCSCLSHTYLVHYSFTNRNLASES